MAMGDQHRAEQFELDAFLPYMLNRLAEATSRDFETWYTTDFGLTRTQWRLMAHVDAAGSLTAKDISARIQVDKVGVSRAVAALDANGYLARAAASHDRRFEVLSLSAEGRALFAKLVERAEGYERGIERTLGPELAQTLRAALAEALPKLIRRE
jgi:DNA-binding MarR family transcriptional regulator